MPTLETKTTFDVTYDNVRELRAIAEMLHKTGEHHHSTYHGLSKAIEKIVAGTQEPKKFVSFMEHYWGACPECGEVMHYGSGPNDWFVCHEHKIRWCVGSNLFSAWRWMSPQELNSLAEKVIEIESQPGPTDFNDLKDLVAGHMGQQLFQTGEMESGVWASGMVQGLIHDIPSCEEVIQRIMSECEEIVKERLLKFVE